MISVFSLLEIELSISDSLGIAGFSITALSLTVVLFSIISSCDRSSFTNGTQITVSILFGSFGTNKVFF